MVHDQTPAHLSLEDTTFTPKGEGAESIPYAVPVASSIEDIVQCYAEHPNVDDDFDAEAMLVDLFNQQQRRSASILFSRADADADVNELRDQAARVLYKSGRTGGGGGGNRGKVTAGVNKKAQADMGAEIARRTAEKGSILSKAEMEEIFAQFGLNPGS